MITYDPITIAAVKNGKFGDYIQDTQGNNNSVSPEVAQQLRQCQLPAVFSVLQRGEKGKILSLAMQSSTASAPAGGGTTLAAPSREASIVRQCCLKAAVEFNPDGLSVDERVQKIIEIADKFEAWVNR